VNSVWDGGLGFCSLFHFTGGVALPLLLSLGGCQQQSTAIYKFRHLTDAIWLNSVIKEIKITHIEP